MSGHGRGRAHGLRKTGYGMMGRRGTKKRKTTRKNAAEAGKRPMSAETAEFEHAARSSRGHIERRDADCWTDHVESATSACEA